MGDIGTGGVARFQGIFSSSPTLHYFAGQITDVRLWQRVKSVDEINQDRFAAPNPNDADLVTHLPITKGQGLVVRDRASNPSQGALQVPDLVLDGNRIELRNVHSYYNLPVALTWTNYVYTGTFSLTDTNGAIGVSFLVTPGDQNQGYLLRRTAQQQTFQLVTLSPGSRPLTGNLDTRVNPTVNTDYRFRIDVVDNSSRTTIRVKIWQDGTLEPDQWQID